MQTLNRTLVKELKSSSDLAVGSKQEYPVKVMQFGEGNFMRAFIDWMIDVCNEQGKFNGMVQMVQPLHNGMADMINAQDGLYTLILRGMENGKAAEYKRVITCVKGCLKVTDQWAQVVATATGKDLRFVFSNTTESGIEYKSEAYTPGQSQQTFPAKLTSLLFERFKAKQPGLIFIPCELIDKNGATLKKHMLQYAADWQLGQPFIDYINRDNVFFNTLVDRIVAGYPKAEAPQYCAKLGYQDNLLDCGEIFHLFVIEGDSKYANELPFAEAGLNVVWTDNQTPYRSRKVRFLNGGHTSSVLAAYLAGFDLVDQMTSDALFGTYLKRALLEEVFPTIPLPDADKKAFAESIIDRFLNPFANHQLISISLNSISKWQVRVLPSLLDYQQITGDLPKILTFSLAALIAFYNAKANADGSFSGTRQKGAYPVADDAAKIAYIAECYQNYDTAKLVEAVLGREDFWGKNLNLVAGLTEAVTGYLTDIQTLGMTAAVQKLLKD